MNQNRFDALWRRAGGGGEAIQVFEALEGHYGDASRHYHDCGHVAVCLAAYDDAINVLGADDGVEMTLWFHDAIFTPGARDNEARSVEWFATQASGFLPATFISETCDLIQATDHRASPKAPRAQFAVDVDLWGLSQPWDAFFLIRMIFGANPSMQATKPLPAARADFCGYSRNARRFIRRRISRSAAKTERARISSACWRSLSPG